MRTRDGVICGLAALLSGDQELIRAFQRTLTTLRNSQGPHGEVASVVGNDGKVSYGDLAGCADVPLWYVIGVCALGRTDTSVLAEHEQAVSRALWLTEAWEYNARGLVYVPLGGSWADEYVLHGYLLSQQLLALWAWRAAGMAYNEQSFHAKSSTIESLLHEEFWVRPDGRPAYHPMAYATALERHGPSRFWCAAFHPGGYDELFDALGNGLALMLGLEHSGEVTAHVHALLDRIHVDLMPCYDPPITRGTHRWEALNEYHTSGFRNRPGEYQNGGLWPMMTGFVAAGAAVAGDVELTRRLADGIDYANAADNWAFAEYHRAADRQPDGELGVASSAAAAVIARAAVERRTPVALTDTRVPLHAVRPAPGVPAGARRPGTSRPPGGPGTPPPARRLEGAPGPRTPAAPGTRPSAWPPGPSAQPADRRPGSPSPPPSAPRPDRPSSPGSRPRPQRPGMPQPGPPPRRAQPPEDDGWGPASGPSLMAAPSGPPRSHGVARHTVSSPTPGSTVPSAPHAEPAGPATVRIR